MAGVDPTRIGAMRHRVTFQTLTRTSDGQGGYTSSWVDLATVWGEVVPTKKYERLFSEAIQYQRTHKVIIRYRSDITQEMRMVFDSRIFQIKSVLRPDERRFFLIIDLEENQGT